MTPSMLPAPPLRNVLDDEEVLARPDVAERSRLRRERSQRRRVGEPPFERRLLLLQLPHRLPLDRALRASIEVVVQRPVVEEPDEQKRADSQPSAGDTSSGAAAALLPRGHPVRVLRPARRSCAYWTTSTLITFVVPGMLTAVPAVITTLSPVSTISSGVTPHSRASWRIAQSTCVSATTGRRGRRRATAFAVRPVKVGTRIALAWSASARSHAAFDIAWPIVGFSCASGSSCR